MSYRPADIEKAAATINQMRAGSYQRAIQLEIEKIRNDPELLWEVLDEESKLCFMKLMRIHFSDSGAGLINATLDLIATLRNRIAFVAALDVAVVEPASREEAIDFIDMQEADSE